MFPLELDSHVLNSLPLPDPAGIARVVEVLKATVARRVLPDFRRRKLIDATRLAAIGERYAIARLEDLHGTVRAVTVLTQEAGRWTLHLHERIFDYLAFVIPNSPHDRLADAPPEERRVLAVTELLLRHELDHMLHPGREEQEVIAGDAELAMARREADPTYYRALRQALGDETSGLRGGQYRDLIDRHERGENSDDLVLAMVSQHAERVAEVPVRLLLRAFPAAGRGFKGRVVSECYRRSCSTSYSVLRRARWFGKVLRLFAAQLAHDGAETEALFHAFRERWGVAALFHHMEIPEADETLPPEQLFARFAAQLRKLTADPARPVRAPQPSSRAVEARDPVPPGPQSLKDRIEAARADPLVPRPVLALIDGNRAHAGGVSGAKYGELIETLLAIPWGRFLRVTVSPEDFALGLEASHHGLRRQKELLSDFFTSVILRYREHAGAPRWRRSGSAFLFVGPPGVGKTSLAIAVAHSLGLPYHKLSLGGMHDEADIRGHGFTYEGSKPGAIVQGLVKMGAMNGAFIMDEADKTERFAIATLLEILDPEQNHLYHDKYTGSTVDIDLSACHFILTANTLETVPPAVANRCEIVHLDRYGLGEKVAIARRHLVPRLLERYGIDDGLVAFDPDEEEALLRHLVAVFTHEAGVRQLERVLRTLLLRTLRTEAIRPHGGAARITRATIDACLEEPGRPRRINAEDRVGEMLALGVSADSGIGAVIPIQATRIPAPAGGRDPVSVVHATGNIERVMDESRRVAMTAILCRAGDLGLPGDAQAQPIHLHFMAASSRKDGPSAGGSIALALASLLGGARVRRDVAMTGEIDIHGRITRVGELELKLETARQAGCRTVIIPRENLHGEHGVERLPEALRDELLTLTYEEWRQRLRPVDPARHALQVVAVDDIVQAAAIAFIDERELAAVEERIARHGRDAAARLAPPGQAAPFTGERTVQGLELTRSRPLLARAARRLARLDPELLAACPYVGRQDGVAMVDLAFIPEQYRLDPGRAEEILVRCLERWLTEAGE